jgi:hypothetical protein
MPWPGLERQRTAYFEDASLGGFWQLAAQVRTTTNEFQQSVRSIRRPGLGVRGSQP